MGSRREDISCMQRLNTWEAAMGGIMLLWPNKMKVGTASMIAVLVMKALILQKIRTYCFIKRFRKDMKTVLRKYVQKFKFIIN